MLNKKNIIQLCLKIAGGIANLIACGIFYRLLNKVSDKTLTGSQGNNEKVNEIFNVSVQKIHLINCSELMRDVGRKIEESVGPFSS